MDNFKRSKILFLSLVTILFSIFTNFGAQARGLTLIRSTDLLAEEPCSPVDLVFIVDQTQAAKIADPKGDRLQIIRWMIEMMGYDNLFTCPDVAHRIAVISIGVTDSVDGKPVVVDLPLTPVIPSKTETPDQWHDWLLNNLIAKIPQHNGSRDTRALGEGLDNAKTVLDGGKDFPGPTRKQAIIILNAEDGSPCTGCGWYRAKKEVNEILGKKAQNFPFQAGLGPYIWLLAEPSPDNDLFIEEHIKEDWVSFTQDPENLGNYLVHHNDLIPKNLWMAKEIIQHFLQLRGQANLIDTPCIFQVPAYKANLGIMLFKKNPDQPTKIDIVTEERNYKIDSSSKEAEDMLVYDYPTGLTSGETWIFNQPIPGEWRIDGGDCTDLKVYSFTSEGVKSVWVNSNENHFYQYNIPGSNSAYDPQHKHYLEVGLENLDGKKYPQYKGFEPKITGSLVEPGTGNTYPIEFEYLEDQKIYRSKEPFRVKENGTYTWNVQFSTTRKDEDGKDHVFEMPPLEGKYEVDQVTPVSLRLEVIKGGKKLLRNPSEPNNPIVDEIDKLSEKLPIHARAGLKLVIKPVEFQAVFLDDQEKPISRESLNLTSSVITASLTYPETAFEDEIELKPIPGDIYRYGGSLGLGIEQEGDYLLQVKYAGESDSEAYRLIEKSDQVRFNRVDTWINSDIATYTFMGILLLSTLFAGFWVAWSFTDSVGGGKLEFYRVGAPIGTNPFDKIEFNSTRRWATIPNKKIEKDSKSRLLWHIKKIKISKDKGGGSRKSLIFHYQVNPTSQTIGSKMDGELTLPDATPPNGYQDIPYTVDENEQIIPGGMRVVYRSNRDSK